MKRLDNPNAIALESDSLGWKGSPLGFEVDVAVPVGSKVSVPTVVGSEVADGCEETVEPPDPGEPPDAGDKSLSLSASDFKEEYRPESPDCSIAPYNISSQ